MKPTFEDKNKNLNDHPAPGKFIISLPEINYLINYIIIFITTN